MKKPNLKKSLIVTTIVTKSLVAYEAANIVNLKKSLHNKNTQIGFHINNNNDKIGLVINQCRLITKELKKILWSAEMENEKK